MPPQIEHAWVSVEPRHRVDMARRVIHALNSYHALVFMNFQSRLKVRHDALSHQFAAVMYQMYCSKSVMFYVLAQFWRDGAR